MADIPPVRLKNASEPMEFSLWVELVLVAVNPAVFSLSVSIVCLFKFSFLPPHPSTFVVREVTDNTVF